MVFCTKCWKENNDNTKFCVSCWTSLVWNQEKTLSPKTKNDYLKMIFDFIESKKFMIWASIAIVLIIFLIPLKSYWKENWQYFDNELYIYRDVLTPMFENIVNNASFLTIGWIILLIIMVLFFVWVFWSFIWYFLGKKFEEKSVIFESLNIVFSIFAISILNYMLKMWGFMSNIAKIYSDRTDASIVVSITPLTLIFFILILNAWLSAYNILKDLKAIKWFKF